MRLHRTRGRIRRHPPSPSRPSATILCSASRTGHWSRQQMTSCTDTAAALTGRGDVSAPRQLQATSACKCVCVCVHFCPCLPEFTHMLYLADGCGCGGCGGCHFRLLPTTPPKRLYELVPMLNELHLASNVLRSLDGLQHLLCLEYLDVRSNLLDTMSSIDAIRTLPKLNQLRIQVLLTSLPFVLFNRDVCVCVCRPANLCLSLSHTHTRAHTHTLSITYSHSHTPLLFLLARETPLPSRKSTAGASGCISKVSMRSAASCVLFG